MPANVTCQRSRRRTQYSFDEAATDTAEIKSVPYRVASVARRGGRAGQEVRSRTRGYYPLNRNGVFPFREVQRRSTMIELAPGGKEMAKTDDN